MQLWYSVLHASISAAFKKKCVTMHGTKKTLKRGKDKWHATFVMVWRRLKQNLTCCTNMSANKFMFSFLPVKLPSHLPPHQLIGECWKTNSPTSFSSPKINFHKRTNEISILHIPSAIGIDQAAAEMQMQINDVRNSVTLTDSIQHGHTHLALSCDWSAMSASEKTK